MITLTIKASKSPLEIENTKDGSAVNVGGFKFEHYARYAEGQTKFPDGDYQEITFEASKFRDSYQPRGILSATPISNKGQKPGKDIR